MRIYNNLEEFINQIKNVIDIYNNNLPPDEKMKVIVSYGQPWEKISKQLKRNHLPLCYIGQREEKTKMASSNYIMIEGRLLISFLQEISTQGPKPSKQEIKNKYLDLVNLIRNEIRDDIIFTSELKIEEKLEKDPIIAVSYLMNLVIYLKTKS